MKLKKIAGITLLCYLLTAVLFYYIAGDGLQRTIQSSEMVTLKSTSGELVTGSEVRQRFRPTQETLEYLLVMGATYDRINDDTLLFTIEDAEGTILAQTQLETLGLENGGKWPVVFPEPIQDVEGKSLTLCIASMRGVPGNAVTVCYGDSYAASRFDVAASIAPQDYLTVDGTALDGTLCLSVITSKQLWFGQFYWQLIGCVGMLPVGYFALCAWHIRRGKNFPGERALSAFSRYGFLLKTLVGRDFKTKYKRSILGVLWSFLNPLLTMLVLYLVFSTLFRSNVDNYPVYLLSGLICWNFFSEASGMCLSSITGNAALITKVYVPKYIYPVSRAISSLVNFLLALIPLFLVMLLTKTPFTPQLLLLLFGIACLFLFSLGIGMLLASAMVFFRDTQFLWGVFSMLWMYLTPVFYTESIIPSQWITLYKMNPLYHIIRIFRIILIDGRSPEPKAYALCLIAAVIPFLLGVLVFKKSQDRFVLYI